MLIRSCVFHYEFEFIHPFVDGNGRTGRLWQSLILGKLHPLFEHLPVETMVYGNQQKYYDAITTSSNVGQSGPFIDFMLNEIYKTLKAHQGAPFPNKVPNKVPNKLHGQFPDLSVKAIELLQFIKEHPDLNAVEMGDKMGISSRQIRSHISTLKAKGLLVRVGSNKTGYWKVVI